MYVSAVKSFRAHHGFRASRVGLLALLSLILSGCGVLTSPACNLIGRYALLVTVTDAATGASPSAPATVTAEEGAYREVLTAPNVFGTRPTYAFGSNRPGTYTVTVAAAAYKTFTRGSITATPDNCGTVHTTELTVLLERAP